MVVREKPLSRLGTAQSLFEFPFRCGRIARARPRDVQQLSSRAVFADGSGNKPKQFLYSTTRVGRKKSLGNHPPCKKYDERVEKGWGGLGRVGEGWKVDATGSFFNVSVEKQPAAIRIAIPFLVDATFES